MPRIRGKTRIRASGSAVPSGRIIGNNASSSDTSEVYDEGLAIIGGYFTSDAYGGALGAGHAYVEDPPDGADTQAMRLFIYADDGTGDHPSTTLVGVTDQLVVGASNTGWQTWSGWTNFGGAPTLAPNTRYWLGAWWGTRTGSLTRISLGATDDSVKVIHGAGGVTYSSSANPSVGGWGSGGANRRYRLYFDYA